MAKHGQVLLDLSPHLVIRRVQCCQELQDDRGRHQSARLEVQERRECQEDRRFRALPSVREHRNVRHHLTEDYYSYILVSIYFKLLLPQLELLLLVMEWTK